MFLNFQTINSAYDKSRNESPKRCRDFVVYFRTNMELENVSVFEEIMNRDDKELQIEAMNEQYMPCYCK